MKEKIEIGIEGTTGIKIFKKNTDDYYEEICLLEIDNEEIVDILRKLILDK